MAYEVQLKRARCTSIGGSLVQAAYRSAATCCSDLVIFISHSGTCPQKFADFPSDHSSYHISYRINLFFFLEVSMSPWSANSGFGGGASP